MRESNGKSNMSILFFFLTARIARGTNEAKMFSADM